MAFDPNSDYIAEEHKFPVEHWQFLKGLRGIRRVRVDWAHRYDWASFFMYMDWPYWPVSAAYNTPCLGVSIEGDAAQIVQGPASPAQAQYQKAIITLYYTTHNVGFKNNKVIIEEIDPWTQYLPVDEEQLYWDSGHTQPVNRVGATRMISNGFTYTVTYPFATSIPNAILTLGGNTNSDSISSYLLGLTFPASSLLYQPGKVRWGVSLLQSLTGSSFGQTFCVTQHLNYRNVDWNKFYNAATNNWSYVYNSSGTQITPHPLAAFSGQI